MVNCGNIICIQNPKTNNILTECKNNLTKKTQFFFRQMVSFVHSLENESHKRILRSSKKKIGGSFDPKNGDFDPKNAKMLEIF